MKVVVGKTLKALSVSVSLSAALVGSTALVATLVAPDYAFAKNGNGGGKGGGNGGGKGGGHGGGGDKGGKGGGHGGGGEKGGNGGDRGGKGGGHGGGADKGGKGGDHGGGGDKGGKGGGSADKGKSAHSHQSKGAKAGRSDGKQFSLKTLFGNKKERKTVQAERTKSQAKTAIKANKPVRQPVPAVAPTTSVKPKAPPRSKGNRMAALLGVHPSELGALNAANANANAFTNASPNSRVGKIGAFRDAAIVASLLRDALDEKRDELAGLTPPTRSLSDIEDALTAAEVQALEDNERVSELEAALETAGGTDTQIEADLADARVALEASQAAVDALADEQRAAEEYQQAANDVAALETQVDGQDQVARAALEDAANKPVTDEVEAAVKSILGL